MSTPKNWGRQLSDPNAPGTQSRAEGWKGDNITKQEYSASAPFQEEAPFAEHQCYMGQKPPAHMMAANTVGALCSALPMFCFQKGNS